MGLCASELWFSKIRPLFWAKETSIVLEQDSIHPKMGRSRSPCSPLWSSIPDSKYTLGCDISSQISVAIHVLNSGRLERASLFLWGHLGLLRMLKAAVVEKATHCWGYSGAALEEPAYHPPIRPYGCVVDWLCILLWAFLPLLEKYSYLQTCVPPEYAWESPQYSLRNIISC